MTAMKLTAGAEFPVIKIARLGMVNLTMGRPSGKNDWQLISVYRGKH